MTCRHLALVVLLLLPLMAVPATAKAGALSAAIDSIDANVLFLRHALAPGFGDPAEFHIDDCATQRNLDEAGRRQARGLVPICGAMASGLTRSSAAAGAAVSTPPPRWTWVTSRPLTG